MPHIAILIHQRDPLDAPYFLYEMAKLWREEGIGVSIHCALSSPMEADIAILHVDLTRVPAAYQQACAGYRRVLNREIVDIAKRRISRQLVDHPEQWSGPVIVKTDRNFGGVPELLRFGKPEDHKHIPQLLNYRIYPSTQAVPSAVWQNRDWVVERFLPERAGDDYCLRTWMFFGDAETHSLSYSRSPIVKSANIERRELLGAVPEALLTVRRNLGMDYGKFDYALVDGEPVLYDVNKTPSFGALDQAQVLQRLPQLASGIHSYLRDRQL